MKWWHGDTACDSVLAMLRHFRDLLRPPPAAGGQEVRPGGGLRRASGRRQAGPRLAPLALFQAADCDYQAGGLALRAAADPGGRPPAGPLRRRPVESGQASGLRGNDRPGSGHQGCQPPAPRDHAARSAASSKIRAWPGKSTKSSPPSAASENGTRSAFLAHSARNWQGRRSPTSRRSVSSPSACLGQQWRVRCKNAPASVTATEEFCATAQIVLAELAADDPVFLSSVIEVQAELADTTASPADLVQPLPDNDVRAVEGHPPHRPRRTRQARPTCSCWGHLSSCSTAARCCPGTSSLQRWIRQGRIGLMNRIATVTDHRTATAYFADAGKRRHGHPRGAPTRRPGGVRRPRSR